MREGYAIRLEQVSFRYDAQTTCFRNFSMDIPRGSIFGLLGPNGAGKTTLMHLMTGVLFSQGGRIVIDGVDIAKDPMEAKRRFGFIPQDISLYEELSPLENLDFFGALSGLGRKETRHRGIEILRVLGLEKEKDKPVKTFSGGMKRRVNLAVGMVHNPPILILDEPTVGVDVQTRNAIIEYLKMVHARGTTLLYTSHQLAEAESLCSEVAFIDHGQLLLQSPMHELLQQWPGQGLEQLFLQRTGRAYRNE